MSSTDEEEPFQSSGSEYMPSDEDRASTSRLKKKVFVFNKKRLIESKGVKGQERINVSLKAKGKKRTRNVENWQRNVRKTNKAKGETYATAKSNKIMPKRSGGKECACRKKCFSNINLGERNQILQEFNALANKEKQDIYLGGLIRFQHVARKRARTGTGNEKTATYIYKVRLNGNEYTVCKQAFCSIHGITKHRTHRIASALKLSIYASPDMRGKHSNRPNKIPSNILSTIDNHITSFPRRSSHYSREKNEGRTYLSAELNVSKMHNLYLEKYEPDVFEKLKRGEQCKPKVCYDFYYRYFCRNYNISFGSPRSDTCQRCDRLENLIAAEQDHQTKTDFQTEKQLHLRKSEAFYTSLKDKTQLAKTAESIEVLSFDYQQNLPLPHVPAGDVFYKRQIWQYNFCISSGKTGMSTFYMYDEATSKKGSNEVISLLHHYITTFLPNSVTTLYLFSDNAFAQNKNHTIVKYLLSMVNQNKIHVKRVIHQYPEPGHSFLPCDRSFGLIEKQKRRKERVHVPEEWRELVRKTSKHFRVVDVNQDMIMDFAEHFKLMYKTTFTNKNKSKFSISAYRLLKYEKGSNYIDCSVSTVLPNFTKFSAQKPNAVLSLPTSKMLQVYPLPINDKKTRDVKILVQKYVPVADQWYYKKIFGEAETEEEQNQVEENAEDQVYESDSSFV